MAAEQSVQSHREGRDKTEWEGHGQPVRASHWGRRESVLAPGTRPEKKLRWNLSLGVSFGVVGVKLGICSYS